MMKGRAIVYGNNVNTDVIIPARYLALTKPKELAKHAMEDLDPGFHKKLSEGKNIIVAGRNFGCGSSREHAPLCLKEAGVKAVVAESFARIFFRNAVNLALPVLECRLKNIKEGEQLEINTKKGEIRNSGAHSFKPLPEFIQNIFDSGGLVPYTKKKMGGKK